MVVQGMVSQTTTTLTIHFVPLMNHEPLALDKKYLLEAETSPITISLLKCYVSHFSFYNNTELVYNAPAEAFLLDCFEKSSLSRTITIPNNFTYTEVRFYLGIDNQTNEKGISGGDLDPMKGMYWTWQTGYINMKMEGTSLASGRTDHSFQFHLGGFMAPFASFQPIVMTTANQKEVSISIELADFLKKIELATTHTVMSPSALSVVLSKYAASMFHSL